MWVTEVVKTEVQLEKAISLEAVTAAMREGANQDLFSDIRDRVNS